HGEAHGSDFCSRARQIRRDDLARFDFIIVMDSENRHDAMALARTDEERRKIRMMTDFCRHHDGHDCVPDPYYGGDRDFELVIELLEDACEGLLDHIIETHGPQWAAHI
ncbi:MAG: low molecular weight phosphotyrosine protein phosphatase, partial [Prevotella sp.]|nr:low molecular weight phosphotyrosine protein phosphatase [Prevotella sp.]